MSIRGCTPRSYLHAHSPIAPDASSSAASPGAAFIKDNRRRHAAQQPLLAWPALLSLGEHPNSARRYVPARWLARNALLIIKGTRAYRPGHFKAVCRSDGFCFFLADWMSSSLCGVQAARPADFDEAKSCSASWEFNAFDDSMTSTILMRSSRWSESS